MAKEEQWLVCSECSLLVRSTCSHFKDTTHRSYYYPTDGQLNLVCSSCNLRISNLSDAENHMDTNAGHTELRETPPDDNVQGLMSASKNSGKLQKMGFANLLPATSDIYLVPTNFGDSIDQTTEKMENLVLTDEEFQKPEMVGSRALAYLGIGDYEIAQLKDMYVLAEDMARKEAITKIEEELESCKKEDGAIAFTLTNVNSNNNEHKFEEKLQMLCLVKRTHLCSTEDKKSENKARRLKSLLSELRKLLLKGNTIRNHEIHYTYPDIYEKTDQSNNDVSEISALLGITRESLNIYTNPTGSIKGPVVLCIGEKILTDCRQGGLSGCKIPTEAHKISTIRSTAKVAFVLVVEKDTVFQALADRGIPEKYSCVLVTGSGQPSVNTRIVVRKLIDILDVPVFGLFDGNAAGASIYCTYRFGSMGRAFDGIGLTAPRMIWIGLFPDEVKKEHRNPMSDNDLANLNSMIEKEHIRDDQLLSMNLHNLLMDGEMVDLDIITRYYDLEEYVMEKIKKAMAEI